MFDIDVLQAYYFNEIFKSKAINLNFHSGQNRSGINNTYGGIMNTLHTLNRTTTLPNYLEIFILYLVSKSKLPDAFRDFSGWKNMFVHNWIKKILSSTLCFLCYVTFLQLHEVDTFVFFVIQPPVHVLVYEKIQFLCNPTTFYSYVNVILTLLSHKTVESFVFG